MERYRLIALVALILSACIRMNEDLPELTPHTWETTQVAIPLAVEGYSNEDVTKLTPDDEPSGHVTIDNVWLLQFAGEGDNAVLARDPIYLATYSPSATVPLPS